MFFDTTEDSKKRRKQRTKTYRDINLTDVVGEEVMGTKLRHLYCLMKACESVKICIPARLPDQGPCQLGGCKRVNREQYIQRHRPHEINVETRRNKPQQ